MRFSRGKIRAFTLVELIVATVCLAITAIGILSAVAFTDRQNALSRQRMTALSIASADMELYRSKAFANNLTAGVFTTNLTGTAIPQPAQRVTTVAATADPMVYSVTCRVTWTIMTGSGPQTRSIHLDTALRNNDVP